MQHPSTHLFLILLFFCFLLISCRSESPKKPKPLVKQVHEVQPRAKPAAEIPPVDPVEHWAKYQQLKKQIASERKQLKNKAELESYLCEMLVDSVFSYWVGTPWDFNGHTERPRDGEVACGYFVSTTLRDVGLNLNRFKTAQKAAADIVKQLSRAGSIERLVDVRELEAYMDKAGENKLLVVGMDYHVGFLYKREGKRYFAHSSYVDRYGVQVQLLKDSEALFMTQSWIVGQVDLAA